MAVVVHCVSNALQSRLLSVLAREPIVAGRDVVESQITAHKIIGLLMPRAVDDCEVVGVVLPEDGVERVLERKGLSVNEARHNHAHRQLVLQRGVVDHPLRRRQRLSLLRTVVQAKAVSMEPQLAFQRFV